MSLPSIAVNRGFVNVIFYSVVFWALLYLVKLTPLGAKLEKRGIVIDIFSLLIRTRRLNGFIERLGKKYRPFWSKFFSFNVFLSLALMGYVIYFLHLNIFNYFVKPAGFVGLEPVIPGLTIGFNLLPYLVIALSVVLISHELAHGIAAVCEGIPVSSSGLFIFFILLGGFIEPAETEFNKAPLRSRMKILAAGSASNFYVGILTLIMIFLLLTPSGVLVNGVESGYPAEGNLFVNDVIVALNGHPIKDVKDLRSAMSGLRPGDVAVLKVLRGGSSVEVRIRLAKSPFDPTKPFIGIRLSTFYDLKPAPGLLPPTVMVFVSNTLIWVFNLSLTVAMLNMLPTYLLDGGRIFSAVIRRLSKGRPIKAFEMGVFTYMAALVILNILLTFR